MVFKLPKTEMSWSEPYFFLLRIRTRKAWLVRGVIALGIATLMFVVIQLDQNRARKIGLPGALAISLAAGLTLVAYADCGNIQREVTIRDDCILYNSTVNMGIYWHGSFDFKDIRTVVLMRPGDWTLPHGGLLVQTNDDMFLLAVPHKIVLETVANVLHRLGVSTQLMGWEPSETDTRVQVTDEVAIAPQATKVAGEARVWHVAPEDGPLVPMPANVMGFVVGLTPLVIAFLGAIAAAVYVIAKWSALTLVAKSVIGGVALIALIVGFAYLILVGQFLANRIGIKAARRNLQLRPNALFPDDESLLAVDVYDRVAWTAVMSREADSGLLQIDRSSRVLRFEGGKQRWEIPFTALAACRIEEARVGSEGAENPELRYFVVLASTRDGEPWEAGMKPTRTELGHDGAQQRHAHAQRLLAEIGAAVST